jgi:hypothetical protein
MPYGVYGRLRCRDNTGNLAAHKKSHWKFQWLFQFSCSLLRRRGLTPATDGD